MMAIGRVGIGQLERSVPAADDPVEAAGRGWSPQGDRPPPVDGGDGPIGARAGARSGDGQCIGAEHLSNVAAARSVEDVSGVELGPGGPPDVDGDAVTGTPNPSNRSIVDQYVGAVKGGHGTRQQRVPSAEED